MVQQLNQPKLELAGTPEQQELARQVWTLMRMQGFSYAIDRPISQSLQNLADYFAKQNHKGISAPEELLPLVDQALTASPVVFFREEADDGEVFFRTTKRGKAAGPTGPLDQHSFQTRLNQNARPVEETDEVKPAQASSSPILMPSLPTAAPSTPAFTPPPAPVPTFTAPAHTPAAAAPPAATRPKQPPAVQVPEPISRPAVTQPVSKPAPVIQEVAATAAQPAPAPAPAVQAAPPPPAPVQPAVPALPRMVSLNGIVLDLSQPTDVLIRETGREIAPLLEENLQEDFRFVNFADNWYVEDITGRYSRGDFRRIRELMSEVQGPVSDTEILRDLYNKRTTDHDYEATRFALNFRLSKEKKDFEFVGSRDDHIWTAPGLPPIGSPRRKASEIGTDYKFLEDASQVDAVELIEENGVKRWEHVLTFYEYENGVLPYDASAKALFPGPMLEDQKALVLRFEATQSYINYTAELRYPTGSRGGFIMGLENFFSDNLVPGAVLVMQQAGKSNHFTIEYQQADEQEARLLFYDERRQKFVYRPIVFACNINKELTLSPDRFSKLDGQRRMEESDRKKTDVIVASAFQNVGQKQGENFYALLDDLYPIVNIERPFSRAYLRHLLSAGNNQFRPDEGMEDAYFYKPSGVRR